MVTVSGRAPGGPAVVVSARTVPLAAAGLAALAVLPALMTHLRGGLDFTLALQAAAVIAGSGAGFAADDEAANVLAPSPTPLLARRAFRAATVLGVLGAAAAAAALLAVSAAGPAPDLAPPLAVLAAAAGVSAAFAFGNRTDGPAAPGVSAAVATAMVLLSGAFLATRWSWVPDVSRPRFDGRWLVVAAAGAAVALVRSRDPAAPPLPRGAGSRLVSEPETL